MSRRWSPTCLVLVTLAAVFGGAGVAHARSDTHFAHRYDQVWSAAIRLIRVDYGFVIRDRDEEIGYLLFEYADRGRTHTGSLELLRAQLDGREQVKVTIVIGSMPSYIEQMMLDRLGRKLREDFGDPPPPPRRRPAPPPAEDPPEAPPAREGGDDAPPARERS